MNEYSVSELARLAGVTVRTLHYYDEIGLMGPSARSASGYRLYNHDDLLRLQQILFYKELELPLGEIKAIMNRSGFNGLQALRQHRAQLARKGEHLKRLIDTVDKTIESMTEDDMSLPDEELFAGFTPEQKERYGEEARERWGDEVGEVENRLSKLSSSQWKDIQAQGDEVTLEIAELMDLPVDDPTVQNAIAKHHAWIENFYPCSAERYEGLGQMYVEHRDFRANYEKIRSGLAEFMREAMAVYAREHL
jgi:DNA-binding transcriptional MerR regulator